MKKLFLTFFTLFLVTQACPSKAMDIVAHLQARATKIQHITDVVRKLPIFEQVIIKNNLILNLNIVLLDQTTIKQLSLMRAQEGDELIHIQCFDQDWSPMSAVLLSFNTKTCKTSDIVVVPGLEYFYPTIVCATLDIAQVVCKELNLDDTFISAAKKIVTASPIPETTIEHKTAIGKLMFQVKELTYTDAEKEKLQLYNDYLKPTIKDIIQKLGKPLPQNLMMSLDLVFGYTNNRKTDTLQAFCTPIITLSNEQQKPVGSISGTIHINPTTHIIENGSFDLLMIDERYRNNGLARPLMSVAAKIFNELDIRHRTWKALPQDKTTNLERLTEAYKKRKGTVVSENAFLGNEMEYRSTKTEPQKPLPIAIRAKL